MSAALRPVSVVPPGVAFDRFVATLIDGGLLDAVDRAASYRDTPQVQRAFELLSKASVLGATTTDTDWASALAQSGISPDAIAIAKEIGIYESVKSKMRRVPHGIAVPRQLDSGIAGGRVAEGASVKPVAYSLDAFTLYKAKYQTFSVFSRELARSKTGQLTIRLFMIGSNVIAVDTGFLDPTDTNSITAGGTEISSTGSTATQISTDLAAMIAAITTRGRGLTWVMRRTTAARIALALGAAAGDLPRSLLAIPVVLNGNSPAQITLVDFSEVAYTDDDEWTSR